MIVQLGRNGDIINVLPFAFCLSKKIGGKVNWLVDKEHAPILDGASYVNPVIWKGGGPDTLREAIKASRGANLLVTQAHMNPDSRRMTDSFAKEQWRYVGAQGERGAWPLVFDAPGLMSSDDCSEMVQYRSRDSRPIILCATESVSTPYKYADKLIAMLRGLDANVIDLSEIKLKQPHHLIALFDLADCLVTVDTMHLHLARASYCPVVALINDGWKGAEPPPQTIMSWRYGALDGELLPVVEEAERIITSKLNKIVLVANVFGKTNRHLKARANWPKNLIAKKYWGRSAVDIGNDRPLPFLKDLLMAGLKTDADTIIHINDDCSFGDGAIEKMMKHCAAFDFGCVRRDPNHVGREALFFKSDWLRNNIDSMPDVIIGTERWDLVIARWLRDFRGIRTTEENLIYDFPPVDLPPGLIEHADHPSWWTSETAIKSAATKWNIALWNQTA